MVVASLPGAIFPRHSVFHELRFPSSLTVEKILAGEWAAADELK
jgi:hypothetical protein